MDGEDVGVTVGVSGVGVTVGVLGVGVTVGVLGDGVTVGVLGVGVLLGLGDGMLGIRVGTMTTLVAVDTPPASVPQICTFWPTATRRIVDTLPEVLGAGLAVSVAVRESVGGKMSVGHTESVGTGESDGGLDSVGVGETVGDRPSVGVGDVGVGDVGVGDVGVGDVGLGDVGLGDVGLGDVGLGDVGLGVLDAQADGVGDPDGVTVGTGVGEPDGTAVGCTGRTRGGQRWSRLTTRVLGVNVHVVLYPSSEVTVTVVSVTAQIVPHC